MSPGSIESPHARAALHLKRSGRPRATIGCVQLPTDLTLDEEGPALVSRVPGVRLRLQKLRLDDDLIVLENYASSANRIREAATTLRPAEALDVLGLACTSLSLAVGPDEVQGQLRAANPSAEVTDMASSLMLAVDRLGVRSVALLTPYGEDLHGLLADALRRRGLVIRSDRGLGLSTDEEISAITGESIDELALSVDHPEADALVIACSAFRVCSPGRIDELEELLGKPVITSQQAFLWNLLRTAGVDDRIDGYGRLFRAGELSQPAAPDPREDDLYPSRVADPGLVERVDPVVHPDAAQVGPLTREQLREFGERGALMLRGVFSPEEVGFLRETTTRLRSHYEARSYAELDRGTDMRVITERGGKLSSAEAERPALKSIWQIHLPPEHAPHMLFAADPVHSAVRDARLVGVARQLLGEDVYIHQSRINFQRGLAADGRGGTGFLWHQDFEQWHCEDGMPRMRAVSMAVLLEPAIPQNGALMVMPGSHRRLLQAHADPGADEAYAAGALSSGPRLPVSKLAELADEHGIEYCSGAAGDVVLFDCNVMHGSHTNISPWDRTMLFAVYNAVSNVPDEKPFVIAQPRPEHIGSHDPRFAGVPLPALDPDRALLAESTVDSR